MYYNILQLVSQGNCSVQRVYICLSILRFELPSKLTPLVVAIKYFIRARVVIMLLARSTRQCRLSGYQAIRLSGYARVLQLLALEIDSTAARQHGSTTARQHGSTAARQHGSTTARHHGSTTSREETRRRLI